MIFLSHSSLDKEQVRGLAAALQVAGGNVWFDEWTIKPGDSIPTSVSGGLEQFVVFVLVWSKQAAASRWVTGELDAAFMRRIKSPSCRIIPVLLDDTPLPQLVQGFSYVDARKLSHLELAKTILGIDSDRAFRMAVQNFIERAGLDFQEFWGVGVVVACPRCGASVDKIRAYETVDEVRDDTYRGAECTECGWNDGSEV